jgi:hypothetical protein
MLLWARIVPLLVALGAGAQERLVDLTPRSESAGQSASQSNWREDFGCRGRSNGRIGPAPALSLAVTGLDRAELSMGTEFVADIRVTNTGTEPVIVPTVLAYEFEDGFASAPYVVQGSLGLPFVDAKGREYTLAGTVLRGSPGRPGTVESLAPGESLTIHFPGWFLVMDSPAAPVTGDAQLFARLILSDNECREWKAVASRRVSVQFRGRN